MRRTCQESQCSWQSRKLVITRRSQGARAYADTIAFGVRGPNPEVAEPNSKSQLVSHSCDTVPVPVVWSMREHGSVNSVLKHLQGQCFIFCALCPSESGLIHKHIVKHVGVIVTGATLL